MFLTMGIIGTGKVGTALAVLLKERSIPVGAVWNRRPQKAREVAALSNSMPVMEMEEVVDYSDWIWLTVIDRALPEVVERLARHSCRGKIFAHTSGALSSEVLMPLREAGARVLSFHPLQTIADWQQAQQNLPGSLVALEGDEEAVEQGMELARQLGLNPFTIVKEAKALYHGAAVVASNYLVTLAYWAGKWMEAAGIPAAAANQGLVALMQGALNNIGTYGPIAALTGPIVRGDGPTVYQHLKAAREQGIPEMEQDLYRLLGLLTLEIARERGLAGEQLIELNGILKGEVVYGPHNHY
ncbi:MULTISPECIES: Rossmann-like and DUF2520 domain-containing protein [unclassified Carboxydocella]|uniref:Rossmann-like and DUF2520 domain-containing protein n=1 Tax=unclassified Carboxydocella TaxID=2685367 RepID=UPI0009C8ECD0|nr:MULTISPECIES: DUF2520 domain-containing protein [unclassified Carboxydocella]GAW27480.1 NADP oxidoreductase [Carboxydocella sp. ULO1]GAW30379.1 NADP oxidoreductase [Carboxydocella sp. JDF658]